MDEQLLSTWSDRWSSESDIRSFPKWKLRMSASDEQMSASNEQMFWSNDQMPAYNEQMFCSNEQMPAYNEQMFCSNEQMSASNTLITLQQLHKKQNQLYENQ